MTPPHIHGRFRTVPASLLLETVGASLTDIRKQDAASWADMGAVLGKHEDSASRYAAGDGDMGVVSFLRGCREWDGRFANAVLALVGMKLVPLDVETGSDRASFTAVCQLLTGLSSALEDDNTVDDAKLSALAPAIEKAGKHIDRLRARLRPRAVNE